MPGLENAILDLVLIECVGPVIVAGITEEIGAEPKTDEVESKLRGTEAESETGGGIMEETD